MNKHFFYIALLLLGLASCTSTKNTQTTRFYHSVNTRYNIYFNGNEAYKEALQTFHKNYQESYSDFLLMYPVSSLPKDKEKEGGAFDRAVEKAAKAIKRHSIKAKPKKKKGKSKDPAYNRYMNREEYNPFMHRAWMLMGQAQFFNGDFLIASATFSYISKHYANDKDEIILAAKLWQARCYAEMGWMYEAENLYRQVNTESLPKKLTPLFTSFYADYLLKNGERKEAIPYLSASVTNEKDKTQKNRQRYLLGQLYQNEGQEALAAKQFAKVAGSTAPYPLTLSAQIRLTETYGTANSKKMVQKLKKMSKSSKNKEYLDQIYYAIGNVYLSEQDTLNAIANYQKGVEESVLSGMDMAMCQLRLGDLYFTQRNYVAAQPCYSEAVGILKKDHREYARVALRSEVLDELVVQHEAVVLQDSLQHLASLPEEERLAAINTLIKKIELAEKEEKEKLEREEQLALQQDFSSSLGMHPTTPMPTMPVVGGDNSFYFYNQQAVTSGRTYFQNKWGRRKLEDHWRRRNKTSIGFDEEPGDALADAADGVQLPDSLAAEKEASAALGLSTNPKEPQFYLQQLPLTEEDIEASNTIIKDALFQMALLFKDKLEDLSLAAQTFEKLNQRFPENEFLLESYYQLCLLAIRNQDAATAQVYKQKILDEFPESNYAVVMANPEYEHNLLQQDALQESTYQTIYQAYLNSEAHQVQALYDSIKTSFALSPLMPKFMFVRALSYLQTQDEEGFKQGMKELLERYAESDVGMLAQDILKNIQAGRSLASDGAPVRGILFNLRLSQHADGSLPNDSSLQFTHQDQAPHQLLLVYPSEQINENLLLFQVAAYNFGNFVVREFDLYPEHYGPLNVLRIASFSTLEEVMYYYNLLQAQLGEQSKLGFSLVYLPISTDNYQVLLSGKSIEEYIRFFAEQYQEQYPSLLASWEQSREEQETQSSQEPEAEVEVEQAAPEQVQPESVVESSLVPAEPDSVQDSISVPLPEVEIEEVYTDTVMPLPQIETPDSVAVLPTPIVGDLRSTLPVEEVKTEANPAADSLSQVKKTRKKLSLPKVSRRQVDEERNALLKKQKEEERAVLKAKKEYEKKLEALKKEELKQAEAEKKRIAKEKAELAKQKKNAQKEAEKQKIAERKEREKLRKEAMLKKEAERKALRKQREDQRKQREAERKQKAKQKK